jgi:hypothetical protein
MFNNDTAAGWVKRAMNMSNPRRFFFVYHDQHAKDTNGAQTPLCSGPSYILLDNIFRSPAEVMIDDTGEQSDEAGDTWRKNPQSFQTTKTGFQKFERKLQKSIIRPQLFFEVIGNYTLGLFAHYEQRVDANEDVARLREHDHIVNPPAVDALPNRKRTCSRPAANSSL